MNPKLEKLRDEGAKAYREHTGTLFSESAYAEGFNAMAKLAEQREAELLEIIEMYQCSIEGMDSALSVRARSRLDKFLNEDTITEKL